MKHCLFFLGFILITLLTVRCAEEKTIDTDLVDPHTDYAELTIRLGKTVTRADDKIDATHEEKKIESLACFVQTFDEGIIGQEGYRPGAFLKFFSHEAKGSANGFVDYDFANDPPTVRLKIYSGGFKDLTRLVFIANYEQNGLTDALLAIERMDDLDKVRTPEVTTQGIQYPLLMTGYTEVSLTNQSVVTGHEVILTRIMARIDIRNDANTGDKPFVLGSAQIINPKNSSYLMEGNDDSYNLPVLSDGFDAVNAAGAAVIEGLYTYETANDGSVGHTAVLISGTLRGETYVKRIEMQTAGQPVPLGRNKYYLIVLNKTPDSQEITFTFKVNDWDEGVTIPVRPEHGKPSIAAVTVQPAPGGLADPRYWDANSHAYNLAYVQTDDILRFTFTGNQDIILGDITMDKDNGAAIGLTAGESLKDWITALPKEVDGESVTQTFEIRFRQRPTKDIDIHISFVNASKPTHKETVHLSCWYYPGTQFSPVKMGGIYWAPVNVGATRLDAKKEGGAPVRSNEQMGYYFQWGRNAAHWLLPGLTAAQTVDGPLSYADANSPANINKHINAIGVDPNDWLLPDDPNRSIRDALWSNGNDNDNPCPAGWKIPNAAEGNILTGYNRIQEDGEKRFQVTGDDGQLLYFPFVSHLQFSTGGSQVEQTRILFWLSTLSTTRQYHAQSYDINVVRDWNISYGFTLRCVRTTKE